jgi:hypothetical protein
MPLRIWRSSLPFRLPNPDDEPRKESINPDLKPVFLP